MTDEDLNRYRMFASVFKAFGHPSRVYIMTRLNRRSHTVSELRDSLGIDMSTVSRHLRILKSAGLASIRKTGTAINYSLACDCAKGILATVERCLDGSSDNRC